MTNVSWQAQISCSQKFLNSTNCRPTSLLLSKRPFCKRKLALCLNIVWTSGGSGFLYLYVCNSFFQRNSTNCFSPLSLACSSLHCSFLIFDGSETIADFNNSGCVSVQSALTSQHRPQPTWSYPWHIPN